MREGKAGTNPRFEVRGGKVCVKNQISNKHPYSQWQSQKYFIGGQAKDNKDF